MLSCLKNHRKLKKCTKFNDRLFIGKEASGNTNPYNIYIPIIWKQINQLTGFYIIEAVVKNELIWKNEPHQWHRILIHFMLLVSILYPLKTSENQRRSDVFREYGKRPIFLLHKNYSIGLHSQSNKWFLYTILCTIWYHLYKFKNEENTHEGMLLLVKLWVGACNFTKSNTAP